jgi:signal transduction histidine kinase/CheY-like chemotaxis protein
MIKTPPTADHSEQRVLVFAPIGRDAQLTVELLHGAGIDAIACASVSELCGLMRGGAGAVILTEEALDDRTFPELSAAVAEQPPWADVPILVFAGGERTDMSLRTIRLVEALGNVTMMERPIRVGAVISVVRAALRARTRQYEMRDVLVALHAARAEAEAASRLKDEFLATLSHELRTPLNAIMGWTMMLRHGQVQPDRVSAALDVVDRNARAQAQLIEDVLDIARVITGKLRLDLAPVVLRPVIDAAVDAVRPGADAKGVHVIVEHPSPETPVVLGDAGRLQQIVWNLLSNAVKFTPPGGEVRVRVQVSGTAILLTVADSGIGLSPEFLPFVFDRFRQEDQTATRLHGGLGIGLSIVRHLVELHGGDVSAQSEGAGRGATFTISLPVPAPANIGSTLAGVDADQSDPFAMRLPGRTVLVVDDDEATRELLVELLGRVGARVTAVASAHAALEVAQMGGIDVIVGDIGMPNEDGYSMMRRLRTLPGGRGNTPAIALSAYARAEDRAAAEEAGFTMFLAKPVDPLDLLRAVQRMVQRAAHAALHQR